MLLEKVVLTGDWRGVSALQAANGTITFGWTTALIFYFIQRIYRVDPSQRVTTAVLMQDQTKEL